MKRRYIYSVAAACCLLVAAAVFAGDPGDDAGIASARQVGKAFTAVAREATPAVVFIQVEREVEGSMQAPGFGYNDPFDLFNDDFFQRFFRHRVPQEPRKRRYLQRGQGSGFVISPDGLILTNHHVVGQADRIKVRFQDGRELDAELVGTDAKSDVALLRVGASGLKHVPLGDSDRIEVGEWVVAIGNPFGLAETVTSGIVSAKGRTRVGITEYEDFIQTDAAINPGNSGGPLLNLRGEVVGINAAILSRSGGYMGIGFAIPINLAKSIKDQLLRDGKVKRGFLGVLVQDVTAELAASFGLEEARGALVSDATEDSPASRAGLKTGDVVLELDGKEVVGSAGLRNAVARLRPGAKAELLVWRDGKRRMIAVTLGSQGGDTDDKAPSRQAANLGLEIGPLTSKLAERLGYALGSGVVVERVAPGSVTALAGIRPGNLIIGVNRKPARSVEEFHQALAEAGKEGRVLLRVRDGRFSRYVVVPLR